MGKFLAGLIVIAAVLAGGAMYYLQVYHFYDEVAARGTDDVQLTALVSGQPEPVLRCHGFTGFQVSNSVTPCNHEFSVSHQRE